RDLREGKEVPIVALTAHQGKREVQKCLEAGCTHYLSKPVRKQGVLEVVHRYLSKPDSSIEVGTGRKWQQTKKPAKRK
ncbi:MAG: response regulator, partial [bacterium]